MNVDSLTIAYESSIDPVVIDEIARLVRWVEFVPVVDFAADHEHLGVGIALAAGPGLFLLEALEAAVPVVAPMDQETRRYVPEGGGILSGADPAALAGALLRIVGMAAPARRVMGRIGRNHLLSLVS